MTRLKTELSNYLIKNDGLSGGLMEKPSQLDGNSSIVN